MSNLRVSFVGFEFLLQSADHGKDSFQFLGKGDSPCAGPSRFPAHIEDISSLQGHRAGVSEGGVGLQIFPAVAERIPGHVEDSHDPGSFPENPVVFAQLDLNLCGFQFFTRGKGPDWRVPFWLAFWPLFVLV